MCIETDLSPSGLDLSPTLVSAEFTCVPGGTPECRSLFRVVAHKEPKVQKDYDQTMWSIEEGLLVGDDVCMTAHRNRQTFRLENEKH